MALAALAACTKENATVQDSSSITISASVSEDGSKTVLNQDFSVSWSVKDAINVFDSSLASNRFEGEDASAATMDFNGEVSTGATPSYALYPYDSAASVDASGIISTTVPTDQKYNGISTFGNAANVSVGQIVKDGVMYKATMKNVCGLVRFIIPLGNVKQVKLESTSGKFMSGTVTVSGADASATVVSGKTYVTFSKADGSALPGNEYFFAVLPGSYDGIKATLTFTDDTVKEYTSANTLTVARAQVNDLGIFDTKGLPGVEKVYINLKTDKFGLGTKNLSSAEGVVDEFTVDGYTYGLYAFGKVGTKDAAYRYWTDYGVYLLTKNAFFRFPKVEGKKLYAFTMNIGGSAAQSYILSTGTDASSSCVRAFNVAAKGVCSYATGASEDTPVAGTYYYLHNNTGSGSANNFIKNLTMYFAD